MAERVIDARDELQSLREAMLPRLSKARSIAYEAYERVGYTQYARFTDESDPFPAQALAAAAEQAAYYERLKADGSMLESDFRYADDPPARWLSELHDCFDMVDSIQEDIRDSAVRLMSTMECRLTFLEEHGLKATGDRPHHYLPAGPIFEALQKLSMASARVAPQSAADQVTLKLASYTGRSPWIQRFFGSLVELVTKASRKDGKVVRLEWIGDAELATLLRVVFARRDENEVDAPEFSVPSIAEAWKRHVKLMERPEPPDPVLESILRSITPAPANEITPETTQNRLLN